MAYGCGNRIIGFQTKHRSIFVRRMTVVFDLQHAGGRVKGDRHDAITLAKLLRAGRLTAVSQPDPTHEVMRNLIRSPGAAMALRQAGRSSFNPSIR